MVRSLPVPVIDVESVVHLQRVLINHPTFRYQLIIEPRILNKINDDKIFPLLRKY